MDIREKVIKMIAFNSEDNNVEDYLRNNDNITGLGINSISFIKLVVYLENEFNIEFDDDALDFSKFTSLNELCKYVNSLLISKL